MHKFLALYEQSIPFRGAALLFAAGFYLYFVR